jgi:hypothetical protein
MFDNCAVGLLSSLVTALLTLADVSDHGGETAVIAPLAADRT